MTFDVTLKMPRESPKDPTVHEWMKEFPAGGWNVSGTTDDKGDLVTLTYEFDVEEDAVGFQEKFGD